MKLILVILALAGLLPAASDAGPGDASADSVSLVGEFVDPVCMFQHGMLGEASRQCALVSGRIEQGIGFYDIRRRRYYTVVGQTHWQDPREGFRGVLGETLAVKARVWNSGGASAIAVNAIYPVDRQPPATYRWWPWHFEWSVLLGCGLLGALYLLALGPGRARVGARFEPGRAALYFTSLAVVVVSLNGPLHDLSDLYLFSTHMVQHLFLAQVFPPLFLLGLPVGLSRWLVSRPAIRPLWRVVAAVPVGFALYTVVFTLWHVPVLYDLMMREHGFHILMHLMVMGTAVLMWWPVVGGEAVEKPLSLGAQMLYLFVLGTPMMAVAAMITLAGRPLYSWYALAPRAFGTTALGDQTVGGLIMWVPGGLFWWVIMSVVYFRWAARDSRPDEPVAAVDTAGVETGAAPAPPVG